MHQLFFSTRGKLFCVLCAFPSFCHNVLDLILDVTLDIGAVYFSDAWVYFSLWYFKIPFLAPAMGFKSKKDETKVGVKSVSLAIGQSM